MKISFAHIVNTVSPAEGMLYEKVQSLTLRTLLLAKEQAEEAELKVDLLSAQYKEARKFLPCGIKATTDLNSCASRQAGIGSSQQVPLISEILSRLNESEDATHFIYTNLDICVLPFFYSAVSHYLLLGHDALVINRRRISTSFLDEENLHAAFAETGKSHPGFDCFIFKRELLQKFVLKDVYIGTPPAGSDLFHNLFAFAKNPLLLTKKQLTFHAGLDLVKPWGDSALRKHNEREFALMLQELRQFIDLSNFPGGNEPLIKRHFKWLMNPAIHYPTLVLLDFKQRKRKRKPKPDPELRGLRNRYFEWLFKATGFTEGR